MLIIEVLIGDTTSLRNRVFFSFIPALPFIVSGPSVRSSSKPASHVRRPDQHLGLG